MMEYWEAIKDDDDKLKCFFDFVASSIEDMKHDNKKAYWQAKLGIHECILTVTLVSTWLKRLWQR